MTDCFSFDLDMVFQQIDQAFSSLWSKGGPGGVTDLVANFDGIKITAVPPAKEPSLFFGPVQSWLEELDEFTLYAVMTGGSQVFSVYPYGRPLIGDVFPLPDQARDYLLTSYRDGKKVGFYKMRELAGVPLHPQTVGFRYYFDPACSGSTASLEPVYDQSGFLDRAAMRFYGQCAFEPANPQSFFATPIRELGQGRGFIEMDASWDDEDNPLLEVFIDGDLSAEIELEPVVSEWLRKKAAQEAEISFCELLKRLDLPLWPRREKKTRAELYDLAAWRQSKKSQKTA